MINIKLSKRLMAIASLVDKNAILADIGCDHALLDIFLTKEKIINKSIACDITKGALDQAIKNIYLYNASNIETRLGDGLNPLTKKDKVDTVVISGLGNQKIINILNENKEKLENINNLIIQSNTSFNEVRKEVIKLGYYIKKEVLVKERNIIYCVVKFCKGCKKYTKKEIYFGPYLLKNKNELFKELIISIIDKNNSIINRLPKYMFIKKINLYIKNIKLKKEIQNI